MSDDSLSPPIRLPGFEALCGRVFRSDPEFFPQVEYRGQVIYFCTEACLAAFLSDPERFLSTHRHTFHPPAESGQP